MHTHEQPIWTPEMRPLNNESASFKTQRPVNHCLKLLRQSMYTLRSTLLSHKVLILQEALLAMRLHTCPAFQMPNATCHPLLMVTLLESTRSRSAQCRLSSLSMNRVDKWPDTLHSHLWRLTCRAAKMVRDSIRLLMPDATGHPMRMVMVTAKNATDVIPAIHAI